MRTLISCDRKIDGLLKHVVLMFVWKTYEYYPHLCISKLRKSWDLGTWKSKGDSHFCHGPDEDILDAAVYTWVSVCMPKDIDLQRRVLVEIQGGLPV